MKVYSGFCLYMNCLVGLHRFGVCTLRSIRTLNALTQIETMFYNFKWDDAKVRHNGTRMLLNDVNERDTLVSSRHFDTYFL